MMKKRLCRVVSLCFIVASLLWHPSGYAVCTEQPPEAQSLSSQEGRLDEEPAASLHPLQEEVALVSHSQSPSEDSLLTEEEPSEEEMIGWGYVKDREALGARDWEMEERAEDMNPEPEPEPEPQTEQLHPEASSSPDQASSPPPDLPPPPPAPESEEAPSPAALQDPSPHIVSEDVATDPDHSELEEDSADCDLTSVPVVLENTSNAHSGGTKTHVDHVDPAPLQPSQGSSGLGSNTSHMLEDQGLGVPTSTETEAGVLTKDPEDIPTFDEWKRKVMEVEKEKIQATHTSSGGTPHVVKKVQKNLNNYASAECGAKILGANPEAKSTSAILMENMDLYMLNPCSNKIWFVIELCEPIQVKQLDIANFELFSSTPKDFLVSISDRYPTNKWLKLGTFHGRDERTVQSFPLDEHLYAKYVKMFTKYIKVELLSHFGSEHFCPLSLIRVFGTSMVEEYEEIADPSERPDDQDDYFDYPPEAKSSNNLIGSATDVILNMVNNIAVNVLGGGSGGEGNFTGPAVNATESSSSSSSSSSPLDPTATLTPGPDTDEVDQPDVQIDPDSPAPEALDLDPPVPEIPPPDPPQLEPPPEGDMVVTLIEEEEVDPPQPTITLLDREEEEEEEQNGKGVKQESLDYCGRSSSTSCSCSASLGEYLLRRCSAPPATPRKPSERERAPDVLPHTHAGVVWPLPIAPPTSQASQKPQPAEGELPAGRGESGASLPEAPEEQGEARPEPPSLEPSQTSSSLDPLVSRPTLALELPSTSTLDPQTLPESSQDPQAEGTQGPAYTVSSSPPTPSRASSSVPVDQIWASPTDERPLPEGAELPEPEVSSPLLPPDEAPSSLAPPLDVSPPTEPPPPPPPAEPESGAPEEEESLSSPDADPAPNASTAPSETKMEELAEELLFASSDSNEPPPPPSSPATATATHTPSHSEIYAELHHNTLEQAGGGLAHASSQKESVFMRLNNRIKALEMNMSLSGRYLEQLSQRYRKQMEEMQRAFNKTVVKLQNTSKMAEEQDQRQTESIQTLQGQLENVTRLVLNLSFSVVQLQNQVSDRQGYLLLCLVLCLLLALMLCSQHCRVSGLPPPADPAPPSYSYSSPDRPFSSFDDASLKRRASYPLLHSASLQFPDTEGPESLHTLEPQSFLPANKKKKRSKMKPSEKVETLKSSAVVISPPLANGPPGCNGAPRGVDPRHPALRDSPSEGSSEGSSHSDDPSFCGIATCTRLCDGLPPPKSRAEKRAFKRRRSKPGCVVVDLQQAPRRDTSDATPLLQDLRRDNQELGSGRFGVTPLSGPV